MTKHIASLLVLLTMAMPLMTAAPSFAQFSGDVVSPPEMSRSPLARSVLVSGAGELSPETISVVATALGRRFSRHEPETQISQIQLVATPNANVSEDMALYHLTVYRDRHADELENSQFDELWERVRKELERSLRIVQRTARAERQDWGGVRLATLEKLSQQYREELNVALAESERLDSEVDGPLDEVTAQLVDAVKRLRELQLERVSLDARRNAIESRIDELRKRGEGAVESDPVLDELRKIVEIRYRAIARIHELQSAGVVGGEDATIQDAETSLATARIELLRAERAAAEQSSGPLLRGLNDELSKLFIEDAELQARIKALDELAAKLREQTSVRTRLAINQTNDRIETLKARVKKVNEDLAELEQRNASEIVGEITIRPLDEALAPTAEAEESAEAP